MAVKHGCELPTGISASGVYLHQVDQTTRDVSIVSMDDDGAFGAGKSIRTEVQHDIRGVQNDSASLPTAGTGAGTSASPHIDEVRTGDKNEDESEFSISARHFAAGQGDWSA